MPLVSVVFQQHSYFRKTYAISIASKILISIINAKDFPPYSANRFFFFFKRKHDHGSDEILISRYCPTNISQNGRK